jgi:acyl-[acyl-carrier-protein]-phospholipid O-acyltransferase/long-chain-fatty-acid--[acyl-carrier-protein] ligase
VIDFHGGDIVFNAMPMFHAFGLTGGTILPLVSGVRTFHYPSPLHYRIVPALIYDTDATICFGTDTFLNGWARYAHPYDFYAMRYIFAGAEKVREETRRLFADRFGVRVLEGYGATETAPVLALNTAMHCRPGTVGRFLPGIEWRLEPVAGIDTGGRLFVRGCAIPRLACWNRWQMAGTTLATSCRWTRRGSSQLSGARSASPRSAARWCR